ncbi:MAG TPA: hypothetical protein EYO58_10275 [Flavobacteriales bacterium]|nr:hypothetical protein [Flavobacteriales bacterium]
MFKIIAVSDTSDSAVASRFGETGPHPNYLLIHCSGVRVRVKRFNRIHVLVSIHTAQVHAAVRVASKKVIQPKKHWHLDDLWFVFNRKRPATSGVVLVTEGLGCYIPPDAAAIEETLSAVMSLDLAEGNDPEHSFSPYHDDEYYFDDAVEDLSIVHKVDCVPACLYTSPIVEAEAVLCMVSQPRTCAQVPHEDRSSMTDRWDWCQSRHCENPTCVGFVCGVNRASISKTSPYSKAKSNIMLQHKRSGCTANGTLYRGCQNGYITGMEIQKHTVCHCPICSLCKAKRASFGAHRVSKSDAQLQVEASQNTLVFDYCGPVSQRSKEGARGFFAATHRTKKYCQVFPVKEKSAAALCIKLAVSYMRRVFQIWVWHVHTDNAKEHKGCNWTSAEREFNFQTTYAPDYTPVKNNLAEHMNYILVTKALCMMTLTLTGH